MSIRALTRAIVISGAVIFPNFGFESRSFAVGAFSTNGPMHIPRYFHTATVLQNGTVLVAGGDNDTSGPLSSAEIYDPSTGTWTNTGSMSSVREHHTAT